MHVGSDPSGRSNASAREWAGSVDRISVRRPASAQASAVAAATVVLPTPPLPVKRRTRTRSGLDPGLELLQGGADDPALGPPLHESGDRDPKLDVEQVGDVGVAVAGGVE